MLCWWRTIDYGINVAFLTCTTVGFIIAYSKTTTMDERVSHFLVLARRHDNMWHKSVIVWKYKMWYEGHIVYHSDAFSRHTVEPFHGWKFDHQTGEVVIRHNSEKRIRFFDKHEPMWLGRQDLCKLLKSSLITERCWDTGPQFSLHQNHQVL